ncbi:hypothetical protein GCM10009696_12510 [Kocuria himachalensis]
MAGIGARAHQNGSLTGAVPWRDPDTGKQTSRTVDDQREAVMLEDFLDAHGSSFRLAGRSAAELRSRTPKLADVVTGHIQALTGVESGTRATYERMAAKHILPSLGARPVDKSTRADFALSAHLDPMRTLAPAATVPFSSHPVALDPCAGPGGWDERARILVPEDHIVGVELDANATTTAERVDLHGKGHRDSIECHPGQGRRIASADVAEHSGGDPVVQQRPVCAQRVAGTVGGR